MIHPIDAIIIDGISVRGEDASPVPISQGKGSYAYDGGRLFDGDVSVIHCLEKICQALYVVADKRW